MWAGTVYKCCCDQHSLTMRAVKSSQVWCRAIQIHQRSLTSKCRWSKRIRLESSPRQISATSRSNSHKREWICGSCTVTNVGSLRRQCLLVQTLPSTKCRDSLKTNQQAPTLEWVAQNWPRRKPVLEAECRQVKIIWTRQPDFEFDHWFSAQPAPLRGVFQCPGTWGAAWLRLSGTFIKDLLLYRPLEDSAVVKVGDSRGHLIAISQWSWRWKSEDHDFLSVTPKLPELMNGALQHLSKWPQQAHRLRKCLRGMWMIQEDRSMPKSWKRSGYCLELRYKLKVGKKLKIVGLRV